MRTKLTNENFIKKAKKIHGDKYEYGLVNYLHSQKKVIINCKIHGIFEQKANNHLRGQGCKLCGNISRKNKITDDKFLFVEKAKKVHGDKYEYGLVNYLHSQKKIFITCKEHGIFKQTPSMHLIGEGCCKCAYEIKSKMYMKSQSEFIIEAKKIHGDKYDYSLVKYIGSKKKVSIVCREHDLFKQTPCLHLRSHGCPICKQSKGERIISNILNINSIVFIPEKTFDDCVGIRNKLPFDFYLPEQNTVIEFDGIQHYKPIDLFGGDEGFKKIKITDDIKNIYCKSNKIKMIRIKYNNIHIIDKILRNEKLI